MTTMTKTGIHVDRRMLAQALQKIVNVIPRASTKPVLQCVRIEASNGLLWLSATNLQTSLAMALPVNGELPRCLAPCRDLLQRVKASKSPDCELWQEDGALGVNGGAVEHRLPLQDLKDYPPISVQAKGKTASFPGGEFRQATAVALTGVANECTRYAINGVLLEIKEGARMVATDGRRMVVAELGKPNDADGEVSAILSTPTCQLIRKLVEKDDRDSIRIYIDEHAKDDGTKLPSDLYVVGPGWVLHTIEIDGRFPVWRDVVPKGGSGFMMNRQELLFAVQEVSLACNSYGRGIELRLAMPATAVSARCEGHESSGQVKARFCGGGDDLIVTGFNPEFLVDALQTIEGKDVVFELQQNKLGTNGKVYHWPPVISGWSSRRVRWVVMPVSTGVEPSRETLGSNFRETAVA